MKIKILISALAIAILFTGCASIMHGPLQFVEFTSQPTAAKVTIDGKDCGFTPNTVALRRMGRTYEEPKGKKSYKVKIELVGYEPVELEIRRTVDICFLGNIIFGGVFGLLIDSSNGSMYQLSPGQVEAFLDKSTALNEKVEHSLYIGIILSPDVSWKKIGELTKTQTTPPS